MCVCTYIFVPTSIDACLHSVASQTTRSWWPPGPLMLSPPQPAWRACLTVTRGHACSAGITQSSGTRAGEGLPRVQHQLAKPAGRLPTQPMLQSDPGSRENHTSLQFQLKTSCVMYGSMSSVPQAQFGHVTC